MARILSVSYDVSLLTTREFILKQMGHEVVSALGFTHSLQHCQRGHFDLFILGHSIPIADKEALIAAFRVTCNGPVLALKRPDEAPVRGADYETEPQPEKVVALVEQITSRKVAAD